jgi:phosphopantetheinyl transferase (holo-ACP synthase)
LYVTQRPRQQGQNMLTVAESVSKICFKTLSRSLSLSLSHTHTNAYKGAKENVQHI